MNVVTPISRDSHFFSQCHLLTLLFESLGCSALHGAAESQRRSQHKVTQLASLCGATLIFPWWQKSPFNVFLMGVRLLLLHGEMCWRTCVCECDYVHACLCVHACVGGQGNWSSECARVCSGQTML